MACDSFNNVMRAVVNNGRSKFGLVVLLPLAFSGVAAAQTAQIAFPQPGSQLPSTSVAFIWSAVGGADGYWLDVGTIFAQGNTCATGQITGTAFICEGIPTAGSASTIYVQLWTHSNNGNWLGPVRYTYTPPPGPANIAAIASPQPGTQLPGTTVTFTWNAIAGADYYWLDVGTVQSQGDICAGATTDTASTCGGIPGSASVSNIYVQLWTHINNQWVGPQQYTYTPPGTAQITSPTPGTDLPGSTVTFRWNAVPGADSYWIDIGSIQGRGDICPSGQILATSFTCASIPSSAVAPIIYVQLWTHANGAWVVPPQQYTYNPPGGPPGTAHIISPAPGTPLPSSSVTFTWDTIDGADGYWLDVGNSLAQGDICASGQITMTTFTCGSIPSTGTTIFVQLWTHTNGAWLTPRRYTYTPPAPGM